MNKRNLYVQIVTSSNSLFVCSSCNGFEHSRRSSSTTYSTCSSLVSLTLRPSASALTSRPLTLEHLSVLSISLLRRAHHGLMAVVVPHYDTYFQNRSCIPLHCSISCGAQWMVRRAAYVLLYTCRDMDIAFSSSACPVQAFGEADKVGIELVGSIG